MLVLGIACTGLAVASGKVEIEKIWVGGEPNSVAIADFNDDGFLDFATPCSTDFATSLPGSCTVVSVVLGYGDGTFKDPQNFNVGPLFLTQSISAVAGDIDNNGLPDIVVANFGATNTFSVMLNTSTDGNLSFKISDPPNMIGAEPVSVALADFNNDGNLDVATANIAADPVASVSIRLGIGDGTFGDAIYFVAAGANANDLAVGDLNGDLIPDIAVTYSASQGTSADKVGVLFGNGKVGIWDGTFEEVEFFDVGNGPTSVELADFDNNGALDLAVTNYLSNNVTILLNDGDGVFSTKGPGHYATGDNPISAAVADFNCDGKLDLAVANEGSNDVTFLLGNGNGILRPSSPRPVSFGAGGTPSGKVAVGDFNSDGHIELAVPLNEGEVLHISTMRQLYRPDENFIRLRDSYFIQNLLFNPVVSTYLGGDGYSNTLQNVNGKLRDFSADALNEELKYYSSVLARLLEIDPGDLTPIHQIDHRVMKAQLTFLIHAIDELRLHERAIESYIVEPINGVMGQLQQLLALGGGLFGTEEEWNLIVKRVQAIPSYLATAEENLQTGIAHGNLPDWRKIQRDGIDGSNAAAAFFAEDLPGHAEKFLGDRPFAGSILGDLNNAVTNAAEAYNDLGAFLEERFDLNDHTDHFAIGEKEYRKRIVNNFGLTQPISELFDYGNDQTVYYENKMFETAEQIAEENSLGLNFSTDEEKRISTRTVFEFLQQTAPQDDEQLLDLYQQITNAAVLYGREQNLFDIPEDYKIDIVYTPEVLRSSLFAAYIPAPPFKSGAVGQFMVTPTENDPAKLAENSPSKITAVAVHEGFPGHDWHFKFMAENVGAISNIRWLPIGSVQDELAMWSDSMGAEGWAHYSEELMAEPSSDSPLGFYTTETYVSFLQQAIWRAARVRVDIGIHTGRMSYDNAVDYFCKHVLFYPDARANADTDPKAKALFEQADREIYRYSKWPTQAITYNLSKNAVLNLRDAYKAKMGKQYVKRDFHEKVMLQGTISPEFYRDVFLGK